jgi:inorganic pyrophosphatase
VAHETSGMPEPGSEAISPSPALSGSDSVVQSLRCCFPVGSVRRSVPGCTGEWWLTKRDAADHAVADQPRPRSTSPSSPPPSWRSAGLSRSLAVPGPPATRRPPPRTAHLSVRPDCCGRKRADPVAGDNGIGVVTEILGRSHRCEFGHEQQVIRLGPALPASRWPRGRSAEPGTVAGKGGPLDTLTLARDPAVPGWHVVGRRAAVLWMAAEIGPDVTVARVPARSLGWHAVIALRQAPGGLLSEIRRFPGICTDLESGKETSVRGFEGREAALAELTASRERLKVGAEVPIDAGVAT